MKVYILVGSAYCDHDAVLGAYVSLEEAQAAAPGKWRNNKECPRQLRRKGMVCYREQGSGIFLVLEFELLGLSDDAMAQFALAVLSGDPVACDAASDVLSRGG